MLHRLFVVLEELPLAERWLHAPLFAGYELVLRAVLARLPPLQVVLIDEAEDVLCTVCVDEAEFVEIDASVLIVVDGVVHRLEVLYRHANAAEFATIDEFFEAEIVVLIDVKVPERLPVLAKLFFNSHVDHPDHFLDPLFVRFCQVVAV